MPFQFVVPVRTLCNGDLDRNLKFEVYDHNKSGNHSYIGEFFATARNLIEQKSGSSFTCVNLKKKVCVLQMMIINDCIEFPYFLHAYANIFPLDTTILNLVDMGQGNAQFSNSGRLGQTG